jgi:hypothetical protein
MMSVGKIRYANNSNYRNDSLIRKESECTRPWTIGIGLECKVRRTPRKGGGWKDRRRARKVGIGWHRGAGRAVGDGRARRIGVRLRENWLGLKEVKIWTRSQQTALRVPNILSGVE